MRITIAPTFGQQNEKTTKYKKTDKEQRIKY